jgi:hypothetical protein
MVRRWLRMFQRSVVTKTSSILPWSQAVSGLRMWRHTTTSNVKRGSRISYVFDASLAGKIRGAWDFLETSDTVVTFRDSVQGLEPALGTGKLLPLNSVQRRRSIAVYLKSIAHGSNTLEMSASSLSTDLS